MSLKSVKQALLDKFQGLSTIAIVSGYDTQVWHKYPAAALRAIAGNADFETTHHHRRRRIFNLRVYVDRSVWNEKEAEELSLDILDEIETALDRDVTLSGLCAFVAPTSWSTDFEIREFDVKVLTCNIEATEIIVTR